VGGLGELLPCFDEFSRVLKVMVSYHFHLPQEEWVDILTVIIVSDAPATPPAMILVVTAGFSLFSIFITLLV
jgi:hypothetical protein